MDDPSIARFYVQVDSANNPYEVLGINHIKAPTLAEVRTAYRSLALVLHPDKAPPGFADLQQRLFVKIKHALDVLDGTDPAAADDENAPTIIKSRLALTEGPISPHQRVQEYQDKLRQDRERALKSKLEDDKRKAKLKEHREDLQADRARLRQEWEEICRISAEKSEATKRQSNPSRMEEAIQKPKALSKQAKLAHKARAQKTKERFTESKSTSFRLRGRDPKAP